MSAAAPFRVIIDPGHGGRDHGTVHASIRESEITLKISKLLAEKLQADPRFQVELTRAQDVKLTLETRVDRALHVRGDVLLSIHANSSPDKRAKGAEFYFQNQLPPDEEALFLAARENNEVDERTMRTPATVKALSSTIKSSDVLSIVEDLLRNSKIEASSNLVKALIRNWQGEDKGLSSRLRQAPFYVISNVQMPSALIEVGYLSNEDERNRLTDPAYQKKIAESLYLGLLEFKESMDKTPLSRLD